MSLHDSRITCRIDLEKQGGIVGSYPRYYSLTNQRVMHTCESDIPCIRSDSSKTGIVLPVKKEQKISDDHDGRSIASELTSGTTLQRK